MIIDSHCHLNMKEFNNDLDEVIQNARNNNIIGFLTICTKVEELDDLRRMAGKYNLWYSGGIHPNNIIDKASYKNLSDLYRFSEDKNFIGIGETGLDFFYSDQHKEHQISSLLQHINISRDLDLPIIIHTRNADKETIEILKNEYKRGKYKGLIHCFTASKELAIEVLNINFSISFSGIITFKNAQKIREVAHLVPNDKILIETDAPFLAPVPKRGQRNEPAFVKHTGEYLAKLKGISEESFFNLTSNNFLSLFEQANL